MAELGPDVWNPAGDRILGAPVGHCDFVGELPRGAAGRGAEIAGRNPINPRLAMFVAGAPPVRRALMSSSVAHGSTTVCTRCAWARFWDAAHDGSIVRIPQSSTQVEMARNITTLPMRTGGLGLRSAVRTAPGAFWASWADALPMLQQRLQRLTGQVVHHLSHPDAPGCLGELQESVRPTGTSTGSSLVLVGRCCDEVSDLDLL